jgi:hypothetical protein
MEDPVNRTIMIHTVDGPIFCIGEELFRAIILEGMAGINENGGDPIAHDMVEKMITHLDRS